MTEMKNKKPKHQDHADVITEVREKLIHAYNCWEHERSYMLDGIHLDKCQYPECDRAKGIISHLASCDEDCELETCDEYRKILRHWFECPKRLSCDFCKSPTREWQCWLACLNESTDSDADR